MKTYLRYSMNVRSKQYPYIAPEEIEKLSLGVKKIQVDPIVFV